MAAAAPLRGQWWESERKLTSITEAMRQDPGEFGWMHHWDTVCQCVGMSAAARESQGMREDALTLRRLERFLEVCVHVETGIAERQNNTNGFIIRWDFDPAVGPEWIAYRARVGNYHFTDFGRARRSLEELRRTLERDSHNLPYSSWFDLAVEHFTEQL